MTDGTERFLVTGSEGCIGSWVVRNLLESGLPVIACDIAPKSLRLERILTPELLDRLVYLTADLTVPGSTG
jgi:nucleoside-diphosphate-sugar epimerase